jgi:mRNA interferase RelE/StbE
MASFRIEFARAAEKDLRGVDRRYLSKILESIEGLQNQPRPQGCKKLVGSQNTYRIRIGDYRVIYEIEDSVLVILIVRIRHRQDVYR